MNSIWTEHEISLGRCTFRLCIYVLFLECWRTPYYHLYSTMPGKKKDTWFRDSSECSLSYSPTKYYKSFLHVITVVVFFKSGLLEGQVMLENSKGFLGTFNEVVEQIIWKKKKKKIRIWIKWHKTNWIFLQSVDFYERSAVLGKHCHIFPFCHFIALSSLASEIVVMKEFFMWIHVQEHKPFHCLLLM